MDFFSRQEQSRRTTRYLVLLFGLAFLAVALATTVIAAAVLGFFTQYDPFVFGGRTVGQWIADNAATLALIVLGTMAVMSIASLYRAATLAGGGATVARMLGGAEVRGDEADPLRRRLVHVVEEMAIASGVPVPEIYVLEQEQGINAFAAGLTHADAAVAVTRGGLERLNRAELQGVVAHEFSHILNGDMRLNQRLMGFSFGILVLWLAGRWLLHGTRFRIRRNRGTSAAVMLGLGLAIIGGIGVLFSRLIKAAVARQREALADASAVQFTRDPAGLAGALKKIGGYTAHLTSVETEEVAHMLFGRGAPSFRGLFATHPPLVERIRALDPGFDPADYTVPGEALPQASEAGQGPFSALAGSAAQAPRLETTGAVGDPQVGAALRTAIPEELYHAAHSAESSLLLVVALALGHDGEDARQAPLLKRRLGAERTSRCLGLRTELAALDRRLWLPLLELCAPALRSRPQAQLEFLFDLVEQICSADERLDLFEYVLLRMLGTFAKDGPQRVFGRKADGMKADEALGALLATAAAYGHAEPAAARAACAAGLAAAGRDEAGVLQAAEAALASPSLPELDEALATLERLPERSRRGVLVALLATIRHDRRVEVAEAELFRAIAAVLGCPMPPTATIR